MKIEMGESLIYSWLRHEQGCQIVQLNWKPSAKWKGLHTDELQHLMDDATMLFETHGFGRLFGKTKSVQQVLKQAECDALGISFINNDQIVFAVDVAYHQSGLLYQSPIVTTTKVLAKCLRNAMCVYQYLNRNTGKIIFASPIVNTSADIQMKEYIPFLKDLLKNHGFCFDVEIITNYDFKEKIMKPVKEISDEISDTSELFLRSYQLSRLVDKMTKQNNGNADD